MYERAVRVSSVCIHADRRIPRGSWSQKARNYAIPTGGASMAAQRETGTGGTAWVFALTDLPKTTTLHGSNIPPVQIVGAQPTPVCSTPRQGES